MKRIEQLEDWVQGERRPDLTILLDVPVEVGLQRITTRESTQGERDRFERERTSFFDKVRHTYLARARQFPRQYRIIDASQSLDNVQQQLRNVLNDYLARQ